MVIGSRYDGDELGGARRHGGGGNRYQFLLRVGGFRAAEEREFAFFTMRGDGLAQRVRIKGDGLGSALGVEYSQLHLRVVETHQFDAHLCGVRIGRQGPENQQMCDHGLD